MALRALLPLIHLLAQAIDGVQRAVRLRNLIAYLEQQVKLRLQLFLRAFDTRVFANLKVCAIALLAHFKLHLIRTRYGTRANRGIINALVISDLGRARVARVPGETIAARLFGNTRLLLLLLLIARFALVLLLLAGEGLDDVALRVEEGQRHLSLRLLLEVVMDDNAIRRILSGIQILFHFLARRSLLLAIRDNKCARMLIVFRPISR